jgi:hypothetical protein
MKHRTLYTALIVLNILVIALFVIQYTSATYPIVGGDYRLFGSRLLDSLLHYKVNGFSIQWYTPSFGGGLPAYPNPLQTQFSLPQLFTFFVNPWIAILASSVIYIIIGFWITFRLLRDVLEFKPLSAILGANFLITSGFFIEQLVTGHADKITFPLIVVPVYALINRKIPAWLAGVLISLTGAILLYSGGEYIGVICLFTIIITLPVVYFLNPSLLAWRKVVPVIIWGSVFTLLLCGSKLYAVTAFVKYFPREVNDHYFVDWYMSIGGLVFQLVGIMTTLPILNLIGKSSLVYVVRLTQWTGSPYGFWELDSSISPALIFLLICGIGIALSHKPHIDRSNLVKKGVAGICLIVAIVLVVQFSTARGFLFEAMKGLPLLKSLRTNTRFVSAFVLPLALLGAKIFDHLITRKSSTKSIPAYIFLNGISLVSLWAYYLLPMGIQGRYFDIQNVLDTYTKVRAGDKFPVNKIISNMNDYEVFQAQASNVTGHYDALLGENSFHPLVHDGSVFDIDVGFYNMTDPTGYVFPRENDSKIFSRIPVSDYGKLVEFLNRRQPDWKLPLAQIVLDWAAGLTFILVICAVCVFLVRKWLRRRLLPISTLFWRRLIRRR